MTSYFITATGTDIGKTLVTAALTWQLRQRGKRVTALKPLASGFDAAQAAHSDAAHLLAAQGLPLSEMDRVCPWRFHSPVSPDLAAAREGRAISMDEVLRFCSAPRDADIVFVEGVGGVMSPVSPQSTVLDWMVALRFPVILVAGSYVGSISHTLTALAALRQHALEPVAVIISQSPDSAVSPEETRDLLMAHAPVTCPVHLIPRLDFTTEIWKNLPNISEGLL